MTMRGGLPVAALGARPRVVHARPVNSLWLAGIRRVLTAGEPVLAPRNWTPDRLGRAEIDLSADLVPSIESDAAAAPDRSDAPRLVPARIAVADSLAG
jgi:hypothetical protein